MAKRQTVEVTIKELVKRGRFDPLFIGWPGSAAIAAELFPLPKVERPRVVTDGQGYEWRLVNGRLQYRAIAMSDTWNTSALLGIADSRFKALADLLAHPSEFVDDEG